MPDSLKDVYDKYCADPDSLDRDAFADVKLHQEDLTHDMLHHSELYLKWARLSAIAQAQLRATKHYTEEVLWREARQAAWTKLVKAGEQKPSKDRVDDVATTDPDYRSHIEALQRCEAVADTFQRIEYAMLHRRDMVSEVNKRQNTEMRALPTDTSLRDLQSRDFRSMEAKAKDIINKSREGE
ncbi:MAG: hypothetical protein E6R03_03800 [Hyphomicrobiaceae bacterium]|nr:MAG: hypothetical protein E6R03_03800 [Hyphomicrobiaceae bacterium]